MINVLDARQCQNWELLTEGLALLSLMVRGRVAQQQ